MLVFIISLCFFCIFAIFQNINQYLQRAREPEHGKGGERAIITGLPLRTLDTKLVLQCPGHSSYSAS